MRACRATVVAVAATAVLSATSGSSPADGAVTSDHFPNRPVGLRVSWVSATHGWLLTSVRCGSSRCAKVDRTSDAGRSWTAKHTPHINVGDQPASLDFTTGGVGYLTAKHVYVTTDGGTHWRESHGSPTAALAIAGRRTYRVTYHHSGCPGPCAPRIEKATTGSVAWHRVDAIHGDQEIAHVELAARGATVIATLNANPAGGAGTETSTLIETQDAGRHWNKLADPCDHGRSTEADTATVAVGGGGMAAALCVTRRHGHTFVAVSDTEGRSFVTPGRSAPLRSGGVAAWIGHDVAIGSAGGDGQTTYDVDVTATGGRTWHRHVQQKGHAYRGVITEASLSAAAGSAAYLGDPLHVDVTTDGGTAWHSRQVPSG
jgi:hypothetical protein